MQFKASLLFLAALATSTLAKPEGHARRQEQQLTARSASWTSTPSNGDFSTAGFGGRTNPGGGNEITYEGNVGKPWGSNIIEVSANDAANYKYVAQFKGGNTDPWNIVFWNKFGPDGKMDGWFGHSALTLTLNAGETKYVAFDDNSQGGWAAAGGSIPTGNNGGYSATWGEFDFGDIQNNRASGFDVSAIQPQTAGQDVQGMKICQAPSGTCSSITKGGGSVDNAYTKAETDIGGIGGNLPPGPVRLAVTIDYSG